MNHPSAAERQPQESILRLSRRRLLALGAMLLPGIVAARWLPRRGQEAASAAGTAPGTASLAADGAAAAAAYDPSAHEWGFVVDTTTCIGCGRCVEACKLENHVPQEPECTRTWIELHAVGEDDTVIVATPVGGAEGFVTDPPEVKAAGSIQESYFVPRLCMQCENPPCVSVCPVSATYRIEDGVVLVDQDKCIGCGYCVVACPYGARYIVPAGGETPTGTPGVADKCTFCYHRITRGMRPACVEVCPMEARLFGDLDDPASVVSTILREKRTQVMKASLGTKPRVHYIGLGSEVG